MRLGRTARYEWRVAAIAADLSHKSHDEPDDRALVTQKKEASKPRQHHSVGK